MKTEPNANTRIMAKQLWSMYTAFVDEGFTPQQALQIIGTGLSALLLKMPNDKDE